MADTTHTDTPAAAAKLQALLAERAEQARRIQAARRSMAPRRARRR